MIILCRRCSAQNRRLSEAGLPVPTPLAMPNGSTWLRHDGRSYEVLTWVGGEPFDPRDLKAIYAMGEFLARFHLVLADDIPPGKDGQLREDHPDLLEPYLARLRVLAKKREHRRGLDEIARQLALVRDRLDKSLYPSLPKCVIHGDIHPGNVRFDHSRVSAVYDFDYLGLQARSRDVSDALSFFAGRRETPLNGDDIRSLTQPFSLDLERSRTLLRGYQNVNMLIDLEWQALPLLMRSRWLQMRLRGSRKVPDSEKVEFVLDRFFEVIDWLDRRGPRFFDELRDAVKSR